MKPDLCIYHANCDDGFGAAYAIWKAHGDAVKFHPGIYQADPPDVTGLNVAIVDFSYKHPIMRAIALMARHVLVLDHHKTAEAELTGLGEECPNVTVEFDMERSGAVMAWQHFHPDVAVPSLLIYIQDRDLWTKKLPNIDEFTAALRSYPQDFKIWDDFSVFELIEEGDSIQRYYRTIVEQTKQHAYRRDVAGFDVPVVNASLFMASELAGELAQGEPFAACYAESATNIIWSLRSRAPDGMDVAEIARRFGGGGHKHAAGFKVAKPYALMLAPDEKSPPT